SDLEHHYTVAEQCRVVKSAQPRREFGEQNVLGLAENAQWIGSPIACRAFLTAIIEEPVVHPAQQIHLGRPAEESTAITTHRADDLLADLVVVPYLNVRLAETEVFIVKSLVMSK